MKFYASFLLLFALPYFSIAQSAFTCGTNEARNKLVREHPEILVTQAQLEEFTTRYISTYQQQNTSRSSPIIIPVVFHILHQGGAENISDEQVLSGLRILNQDFNDQNPDTIKVTDENLHRAIGNIGIEFRLANIDPEGNYTNGIDRRYTVQTYWGSNESKLYGWPSDKYLNIWVVNYIPGGVAGYAYYPGTIISSQDGVVILHRYVGRIGTSVAVTSHTLTHEVGHFFNLWHVWGDTDIPGIACGDDKVYDTPETKGNLKCPTNEQSKVCDPLIVENYQNYMDYSYCYTMFTKGQKERMLAALASDVSRRNNLWSNDNLIATGVADTPALAAAVKADFIPSTRYTCVNTDITFKSLSVNAVSYKWEFLNGIPANSTNPNPSVRFLTSGWQPVKLTVTDANGNTNTKSDDLRVYVGNNETVYPAPFYEGFENPDVFTSEEGWASANLDENYTAFKQVNVAHSGGGSAYLNNFAAFTDHDIDEIISPAIDLTPLSKSQMNLSFYYSWTTEQSNYTSGPDSMCIYASTTCGKNWILIYKKGASALLGSYLGNWVPGNQTGAWKQEVVSMSSQALYNNLHKDNVRFKFQLFSSINGNNFYIDDIAIGFDTTTLGIQEYEPINDISLFPNPSGSTSTLRLQLTQACEVDLSFYDLSGKQVLNPCHGWLNEGENQIPIPTVSTLSAGMYIARIQAGTQLKQLKFVRQL